jgi:hypothetical protein
LFREEFGLGFLLFMVWTIAVAVVLLRSPVPARAGALQPA